LDGGSAHEHLHLLGDGHTNGDPNAFTDDLFHVHNDVNLDSDALEHPDLDLHPDGHLHLHGHSNLDLHLHLQPHGHGDVDRDTDLHSDRDGHAHAVVYRHRVALGDLYKHPFADEYPQPDEHALSNPILDAVIHFKLDAFGDSHIDPDGIQDGDRNPNVVARFHLHVHEDLHPHGDPHGDPYVHALVHTHPDLDTDKYRNLHPHADLDADVVVLRDADVHPNAHLHLHANLFLHFYLHPSPFYLDANTGINAVGHPDGNRFVYGDFVADIVANGDEFLDVVVHSHPDLHPHGHRDPC